jgi:hypothetical protein
MTILSNFFCSTLSEFENFLLCERILINLTTCQNERQANLKHFQRFGAFKGLVEQKNVVFNSFLCKLVFFWHSWTFETLVSLMRKKAQITHELVE